MKRAWLGFVILVLGACSSAEHTAMAERAVGEFRRHMEAREFSAVYTRGSDELKKAVSEADLARILAGLNTKLGKVKATRRNGWNVNFHASGTFVTLSYRTDFERGEGAEQFVFRITGEQAALVSYNVNSSALLLN